MNFSNSMIEAWFRSIKHQWLFLHQLDNVGTVEKLIEFYVSEHNTVMPHAAFHGQTPDEMYFGTGARVQDELVARRREAREQRLKRNREVACSECPKVRHPLEEGEAA